MNPRVVSTEDCDHAVDLPTLIDEIAKGFIAYSAGQVVVPSVAHLGFADPPGDVHIKYGHVHASDRFVVKIATGFPENAAHGLPTGDGLMLVFDATTGLLRAVLLDKGRLTDLRTAAAGAVAARALARRTISRIGVIGTGVQARLQLRCLAHVTPCRDALVWGRSPDRAARYADEMSALGFRIELSTSTQDLASRSDLIVTTTSARGPLFPAAAVNPGTHVTAVGGDSPGKQELDPTLFARAAVVVADSIAQCADHGDLHYALSEGRISRDRVRELGAVLADPTLGRRDDQEITVCDLTGVAVQDIVIAQHVLRRLG